MRDELQLVELGGAFLGTRFEGRALRLELERALALAPQVRLNFSGVLAVTQSCADEFLGVLVAQEGEALLDRIVFENCAPDVKAILELVIGARLEDRSQLLRTQRIKEYLAERAV